MEFGTPRAKSPVYFNTLAELCEDTVLRAWNNFLIAYLK
jgi:hypothetical protein